MQTDKDLFELIKETYPINPNKNFVIETENNLRQMARRIKRKRIFKQFSFASGGLALCVFAMSWFFFFNGKEIINNHLSSFGEEKPTSTVNQKEPQVYIYHTHNWESFFSKTNTQDPNFAWDETNNITLVGDKFVNALKERKINGIHDDSDVMGTLKERGLSLEKDSYKVSRDGLIDTLENHKSIKMVFDIHRDSIKKRDITTMKHNGIDYARIMFTIAKSSSNYEENFKFAKYLNDKIEKDYPGLSRGVFSITRTHGELTYNQDLLNNSLLVDVGGVANTLEEEYRTVEILADVVEEYLNTND